MPVLPRNAGRRHLRADEGEAEDGGDAYSDSGDDTKMSDAGESSTGSYAEDDSSNGQEAMSTRFLVDHVDEVISVNGVAYQIPPNASNEHFLRLIKEIGTAITIPGLSEFLSASQADSMVPGLLALAVLCCIAGSKIRDDDNIRNRAITLEDLFSLIPWQFYAQSPTLNILELYLERQYGMSWRHLSRDVCPVEFLHHRLLERFKEPDVLEDIRFRLRLPVAAGPVDANDGVGVPSSVVATPSSKLVITLFREQPTSHTVLAVTTLRHNDCSTLFVFHHSISIEKRKALESRVTSIFNYVFQKSGVCIRSLKASFPQPLSRGKRKRVLARPMEEEVEISAFSAFQLAHAIVKEARETNQGQIKGGCTILERLASLRSAGYGNSGPDFIIPRDFPPGLPKTDWMRPWSIVHKIRKIIARHIRKAFLLEKFPARPESVIGRKLLLGRKLVQIDNGGRGLAEVVNCTVVADLEPLAGARSGPSLKIDDFSCDGT